MNSSELELIDNYLNGALTEAERQAFEERLAQDERLGREFEQHTALRNVLVEYGEAKRTAAGIRVRLRDEGFFDQADAAPTERRSRWRLGCLIPVILVSVLLFTRVMISFYMMVQEYNVTRQARTEALRTPELNLPAFTIPEVYRQEQERQLIAEAAAFRDTTGQGTPDYVTSIRAGQFARALTELDTRFARQVVSADSVAAYLTAARLCLYVADECEATAALGYIEALRSMNAEHTRALEVKEAYIVTLLLLSRHIDARVVYDEDAEHLFAGYPSIKGYLESIPE